MCEIPDEQKDVDFAWRLPGVTPENWEQMRPRVGGLQHTVISHPGSLGSPHLTA